EEKEKEKEEEEDGEGREDALSSSLPFHLISYHQTNIDTRYGEKMMESFTYSGIFLPFVSQYPTIPHQNEFFRSKCSCDDVTFIGMEDAWYSGKSEETRRRRERIPPMLDEVEELKLLFGTYSF
ncbi:hypothetical protein ADUPG1_005305, partial [Aduncisulcus paluster]